MLGEGTDNVSCVVSELASSRLFQIQLQHLEGFSFLEETAERSPVQAEGYTVYAYDSIGGIGTKSGVDVDHDDFGTHLSPEFRQRWKEYVASIRRFAEFAPRTDDGCVLMPRRGQPADDYGMGTGEARAAFHGYIRAYADLNVHSHQKGAGALWPEVNLVKQKASVDVHDLSPDGARPPRRPESFYSVSEESEVPI